MENKKGKLSKIFDIGHYILMAILLVSLVTTMVTRYQAQKTGQPAEIFGYTPTIIVSGSMVPAISVYGVALIEECDIDDVEIGDIVVYFNYNKGISVIHRVIDEYTNTDGVKCLMTKGDANPIPDNYEITNDHLIGKVVYLANWMAPIMRSIMQEDGVSIDYVKMYSFVLLFVILIWGVVSAITRIFVILLKRFVTNKDENVQIENSNEAGENIGEHESR